MSNVTLQSLTFSDLVDTYLIPQGVSEVTIASSGAVSWALDAGKMYHFTGTLTSLTITFNAPENVAHYHFDFDSGSSPPTISLPAGVILPDGNSFVAGKHYEVDVLNNYADVAACTIA